MFKLLLYIRRRKEVIFTSVCLFVCLSVCLSVCMYVCLSVCMSAILLESYERIFINYFGGWAWLKEQLIRFFMAIRNTIRIQGSWNGITMDSLQTAKNETRKSSAEV